ncbi:MAG: glycerol-3-phosphate 1-O-acyltransferase PlsY [Pseudomonadales bacterium]|nr:glycerol-3-phosphate 1-O-acyltransferase PlsY [Pseudomonadales bacterium]
MDTTSLFTVLIFCIGAYLLGSVSTAVLVCRSLGFPDPRSDGSNNPGTTNVLRIAGRSAAALTLLGDITKGLIPVLIGLLLEIKHRYLGLIGLSVFLGHLYPIFFKFKGGKGVATALGVIHVLSWQTGLCLDIIWLLTVLVFRFSSLAAVISWTAAPFITFYFAPATVAPVTLLSGLLIYRHKANIKSLLEGTEDKIGDNHSPS